MREKEVMPRAASQKLDTILPVLVRLQASLDPPPSLDALAREAGLSRFHFHRLFREVVGETPKQYALRLRLERAALRLLIDRASILDVALDAGFQSHETFSRAFRRRFGASPRGYREGRRRAEDAAPRVALEERHRGFELSETRPRDLGELTVAFIRHVGPYESVSEGLWDRLLAWASGIGAPWPPVLLGIGHDAPGITAPDALRFDAAIFVEPSVRAATQGGIGFQTIPAQTYAVTTHVGPYATLASAYATIFSRLKSLRRYRIVGLPCVEIYRATRVSVKYELNQTEICIPLAER
jgi:AraC family transcriptional regulator